MRFTSSKIITALALNLAFTGIAPAVDLFQLKGKDISGADVNLTVTEEMAEKVGMTEIITKVVAHGDGRSKVRGFEIGKFLRQNKLAGDTLVVEALDGYAMDVPRADVDKYPVLFATEIDGKRLTVRDKGPVWIIYPVSDHAELQDTVTEAKSVWQLKTVEVK